MTLQANAGGNHGGRALRVAVVGSGPSGFYAVEALLKDRGLGASVDMFDRLPTPYGLVRGGVAPDHQKIKSVIKVYERLAADPAFRFFGNVKLGRDIEAAELRRHYDAVIYAVGNESDRKLAIPGEDLEGSRTATEFVGWYNGHPDYRDRSFDLSTASVAVVGIGNVAMDVARILAKDPESLAETDIADYALAELRRSRVREILVLGRRGPLQAAFSPKEIKEIGDLAGSDLVVLPEEAALDPASAAAADSASPQDKQNLEYLQAQARLGEGSRPRRVRLRLCVSPVELIGKNGRVSAVRLERNELYRTEDGQIKPRGTGKFETHPVGLVLRSVGYFGIPIPGVPFDERRGRIPNEGGRVLDPATGKVLPGEYVVGWAKRGPSGLIGTNRADSFETVAALAADFKGRQPAADPERAPEAALALVERKQPRFVRFEDWRALDRLEVERGKAKGKVRDKFSSIAQMLSALEKTEA